MRNKLTNMYLDQVQACLAKTSYCWHMDDCEIRLVVAGQQAGFHPSSMAQCVAAERLRIEMDLSDLIVDGQKKLLA